MVRENRPFGQRISKDAAKNKKRMGKQKDKMKSNLRFYGNWSIIDNGKIWGSFLCCGPGKPAGRQRDEEFKPDHMADPTGDQRGASAGRICLAGCLAA
jgi:hypothetical protein